MTIADENDPCRCDNCGHICAIEGLDVPKHLYERLDLPLNDPRCIQPAGECRRCGALAYRIEDDDLAAMPHAATALKLVGIGEGSAYVLAEASEAPGYEALITDWPRFCIPADASVDTTSITIYADASSEPDHRYSVDLAGRASMIRWYVENVGHDPDEDAGTIPILELVERIASHLLLRAAGN